MLPYGATDLARAFRTVRANTIQIAQDIPESKLDFALTTDVRTVRQLLTHVAFGDAWVSVHKEGRTSFEGFDFMALVKTMAAEEQELRSKGELIDLLTERGEAYASWLDTLTDAFLSEPFAQPPGNTPATKTRLEMLMGVKEHEMHHRGQLMLIQRNLGVVPHLTRERQARMATRR